MVVIVHVGYPERSMSYSKVTRIFIYLSALCACLIGDHTKLIRENQKRFNALGNVITNEFSRIINVHDCVKQITGHPVSTLSLHLMTDTVPYGWNEAYTLHSNHRNVDQKSIIEASKEDCLDPGNTIDHQQLACDARAERANQRNQQGSLQLMAYEVVDIQNETLEETKMGSFARIPLKHQGVTSNRTMIAYKGAVANVLSKEAINALGIAMGVQVRGKKIPFKDGVVNFQPLTQVTDEPDSNGCDIQSLNNLCRKMCLPWVYNEEAKVSHCVRHLHAYFRLITNVTWSATEGGHRCVYFV